MSDFKAKMHQIQFRLGLHLRLPLPLAGFKKILIVRGERKESGKRGKGTDGSGQKGRKQEKKKEEETILEQFLFSRNTPVHCCVFVQDSSRRR